MTDQAPPALPVEKQDHLLSDKVYGFLKELAMTILPGLGTLYFALAGIWGLPAAEKVIGTIVAVDAFLGVIIKLGEASYNASEAKYDGALVIEPTATGTMHSLALKESVPLDSLADKDQLVFKVNPTTVLPSPP